MGVAKRRERGASHPLKKAEPAASLGVGVVTELTIEKKTEEKKKILRGN